MEEVNSSDAHMIALTGRTRAQSQAWLAWLEQSIDEGLELTQPDDVPF
jgi:hypothetical protein